MDNTRSSLNSTVELFSSLFNHIQILDIMLQIKHTKFIAFKLNA